MLANTVYVGRPTIYSNPFVIGKPDLTLGLVVVKDRQEAVREFKNMLNPKRAYVQVHGFNYKEYKKIIRSELKGKNLACFCPLDQPCHADILLKIANDR